MLAVIKTGGKQYKVAPGDKIQIEKLDAKEKEGVIFDEVLLLDDGKDVKVGQPQVEGAKVEGKVIEQGREDKVIIYKYKSKKRFHVKKGHRQPYTMVEITKINA
ncbi:MAG: 50S ribosomal protein L21 [Candidatus Portnoybacteria bacterium RBG_13_41_18]|uniref:Large ribosomal subunit protein bL21 n=1 Tax=Candidatus Portnoybacteria bacterium RBG_13_41_18 TaxID=1801991 RepID=A0A1G2F911_9BACT|nr:MAG: 50S ribosomal protein L21 [Candidatus Portnoybacteria bacterium RBG_13_41_18]